MPDREKVKAISDKEKFDIAREIIRHEDNLVNNRVTWLLVLQGFLFTAFVNGINLLEKIPDQIRWKGVVGLALVALLGIIISLIARNTISVAYDHTNKVDAWWKQQIVTSRIQDYPPIRGVYPRKLWYRLFSTSKMPYLLALVWMVLILLTIL